MPWARGRLLTYSNNCGHNQGPASPLAKHGGAVPGRQAAVIRTMTMGTIAGTTSVRVGALHTRSWRSRANQRLPAGGSPRPPRQGYTADDDRHNCEGQLPSGLGALPMWQVSLQARSKPPAGRWTTGPGWGMPEIVSIAAIAPSTSVRVRGAPLLDRPLDSVAHSTSVRLHGAPLLPPDVDHEARARPVELLAQA